MPSSTAQHLASTTLCIFISAVGAGLLSYPVAFLNQGICLCIATTCFFACLTYTAGLVIVQVADLFKSEMVHGTFEELHYRALGYKCWAIATTGVLLGVFGALVGFTIVIGDMLSPVVGSAFPDSVWSSRPVILFTVTLCVALPLSTIEHIHSLYFSSVLSALSVLVFTCAVAIQAYNSLSDCPATFAISTTDLPDTDDDDASTMPMVFFRLNAFSFLLGVPILLFSIASPAQLVPLYLELPPNMRRIFPRALFLSLLCCCILYCTTGLLGYLSYRDSTAGDILSNFPSSGVISNVARSLLGIHVLLAYPLLLWPARRCIQSLVRRPSSPISRDPTSLQGAGDGKPPPPFFVALGLVLASTAIAVLVPEVSIVFGLIGSIVGTWQALIFPGLLMARWGVASSTLVEASSRGVEEDEKQKLLPGVVANAANPYNDAQPYTEERRIAVWMAVRNQRVDRGSVMYLTWSGHFYLVFGRCLTVLGVVLTVVCTSDYLWSTCKVSLPGLIP